jgi:hypothetical protein
MAGRSLMVAVALSVVALAASCAGGSQLSASEPVGASPIAELASRAEASDLVSPDVKNPALAMALATEQSVEGPTPVMAVQAEGALRGFMASAMVEPTSPQISLGSREVPYGPSAALASMPGSEGFKAIEVSLTGASALGLDVAVASRTGANQDADGATQTSGAEVRIGQRLQSLVGGKEFEGSTSWKKPAWYVFAASDGQALTFTPASPNNFALQDRVEIGDVQAGIAAEANGTQVSLSYMQREVTTVDMIRHRESRKEDFIGLTFTRRSK